MSVKINVEYTLKDTEEDLNPYIMGRLMRGKASAGPEGEIVLIQRLNSTPVSNIPHYRGAELNSLYKNNWDRPLDWFMPANNEDEEKNTLRWIEDNYEPFHGEITIKVDQD